MESEDHFEGLTYLGDETVGGHEGIGQSRLAMVDVSHDAKIPDVFRILLQLNQLFLTHCDDQGFETEMKLYISDWKLKLHHFSRLACFNVSFLLRANRREASAHAHCAFTFQAIKGLYFMLFMI